MLSHRKTKITLQEILDRVDPDRRFINWPMTEFRHAVFRVADLCPRLVRCTWSFNIDCKTTTCTLFTLDRLYRCIYDYRKDEVEIRMNEKVKTCKCSEFPEFIQSLQCQKKIKVKIKKGALPTVRTLSEN